MNLQVPGLAWFLVLLVFCISCSTSRRYEFKACQDDRAGQYSSAVTNYTLAIQFGDITNDPVVSELYLNRAADKYKLGDYTGAIADYDEFLRLHPRFDQGFFKDYAVSVYFARGNAKYAAHDFKGAIADYNKVIHWRPQNADAHYWRTSAEAELKASTNH